MAKQILRTMDFGGVARIINLPAGLADNEPATIAQLKAAIEGLAEKDSAKVATNGNISLTAPGAQVDGIAMALGDRVVVWKQTNATENGIYIWNGADVALTRSEDANTFAELHCALIPIEDGTSAGVVLRQTAINGVLGTDAINFVPFGTAAVQASQTVSGIAKLATLAQVNLGESSDTIVTPEMLAQSGWVRRKTANTIGDGAATSFLVNHNFGTRDVNVNVYTNSGTYGDVEVEITRPSENSIAVFFDAAPASDAYRIVVTS